MHCVARFGLDPIPGRPLQLRRSHDLAPDSRIAQRPMQSEAGRPAPVFIERTSVGLDVHARSVDAAAIDGVTGEVQQTRLTPSFDHIRSWIAELPGPVAVVG